MARQRKQRQQQARYVIVGASGELPRRLPLSARDQVIGVDGGVDALLKQGREPDLAVGDWDSLSARGRARLRKGGIDTISLPKDKDRSDLFFALAVAGAAGAREVHCLGVLGGKRLDHHLAALLDLAEFAGSGPFLRLSAEGADGQTYFLSPAMSPLRLPARKGQTISLFSLGSQEARGVTTRGLKYSLKSAALPPSSRGLSNVATASQVSVALKQGILAVMILNAGAGT
jgi:thiamine pyrophosphokinase